MAKLKANLASTSASSVSVDPESVTLDLRPASAVKKERSFSQVDTRAKKGCIPLFFERASSQWWKPSFDSQILEKEFQRFSFPHIRRRLQRALVYVSMADFAWLIFFAVKNENGKNWLPILIGSIIFLLLILALILFVTKFGKLYERCASCVSLFVSVLLVGLELTTFAFPKDFSRPARFALCTCIIMLIYTMLHVLQLYICILLAVTYSVVHEVLVSFNQPDNINSDNITLIICRFLLHICIHFIGVQIFFMAQVRERSTFWKVGQSVVAKRDLEIEKQVKEKMIRSVMPEIVARQLLTVEDQQDVGSSDVKRDKKRRRKKGQMVFRPFHAHRMDNVSILFADIVGFTKMSSNKSADQLVRLLNDLFGRFDRLCEMNNCEKISTLGDCYYCVAGCPEPTETHAFNCVEMGLDMVEQIKEFDGDTKNDVDMRVGVHTGTVLCGIVGTKRFKFDVWSNDVVLANRMEAAGLPGKVHITETTYKFLNDQYIVEDGNGGSRHPALEGQKTYFIKGRVNGIKKPLKLKSLSSASNNVQHSPKTKKQVTISVDENVVSPSLDNMVSNNHGDYFENGPSSKSNLKNRVKAAASELEHLSSSSVEESGSADEDTPGISKDQLLHFSLDEALMRDTFKASNDLQLVNLMSDKKAHQDYFRHSSVSRITLQFRNKELEERYQSEGQDCTLLNPSVKTFASPRVNFFIDVLLSNIVYIAILAMCLVVFQSVKQTNRNSILSPIAFFIELTLFVLCLARAFPKLFCDCINNCVIKLSGWYTIHFVGAILMCLPMASVFINFDVNCADTKHFFSYIVTVALFHFCNFTQLTSWMKTGLALVFSFTYVALLISGGVCLTENEQEKHEMILCIVLLWLFVLLLNRQLEMGVRRNFSGDAQAAKDKQKSLSHKEQADWLLLSIFPKHVALNLKESNHYSRNYDNLGVIFASIVNFSDFYEENFEGGKECIRVLNELVGDFDDLLDRSEFSEVEKIKTVNGSTFMAGSGLNSEDSRCKDLGEYEHLKQIINFALAMMKVVDKFNQNMLGFKFILRVGFNNGPVTAGVVGTTKLLYDIWGDTVNIASRMDSTGVNGRIQLSEASKEVLKEYFTFERRGTIPVKGKGHITTYLLKDRIGVSLLFLHSLLIFVKGFKLPNF